MSHIPTDGLINMVVSFDWRNKRETMTIPSNAMKRGTQRHPDANWEFESFSSDGKWLFVYQHYEDTCEEDGRDQIYIREVIHDPCVGMDETRFYDGIDIEDDEYHDIDIEYNYADVA